MNFEACFRLLAERLKDEIIVTSAGNSSELWWDITHETERVFEPGNTGGDGHGLGLAVARRIALATGLELRAVADGRGHVQVRLPRE